MKNKHMNKRGLQGTTVLVTIILILVLAVIFWLALSDSISIFGSLT